MASFPFDECTVIPNQFNFEEIIRKKIEAGLDDEPLYIGDVSDILMKHKIWTECFPRITPFYATKCNDSPVVIRALAALGTGFDCASKNEILNVLSFGIPPERIIFAQPAKLKSHMQCAVDNGVKWMTFDNAAELYKTKELYPTAELLVRFRCCEFSTAPIKLGDKFGCDPYDEAPRLIRLAKSLNLNLVGISFHVGSRCCDPMTYAKALEVARNLFDIGKSVGYDFNLLDIGGGFPGMKRSNIESIASAINRSLDTHFPSQDIRVIAEPGRYFVESAFTLVTHVHSKRKQYKNGVVDSIMYYINDGVYGSFAYDLDRKNAKVSLLDKKKFDETLYKSTIWGPTCCNVDMVCENILLPDLDVNTVIYYENMGAYCRQMGSTFNGFPKPKLEFYIEAKQLEEVRDTLSTKTQCSVF